MPMSTKPTKAPQKAVVSRGDGGSEGEQAERQDDEGAGAAPTGRDDGRRGGTGQVAGRHEDPGLIERDPESAADRRQERVDEPVAGVENEAGGGERKPMGAASRLNDVGERRRVRSCRR